jgi:hypothetical protein
MNSEIFIVYNAVHWEVPLLVQILACILSFSVYTGKIVVNYSEL